MAEIELKCLHRAIETNNVEALRKILSRNPELSRYDRDEYSPLWQAALGGRDKIVGTLLEFGANPDQKCIGEQSEYHGFTFIQYMASCDYCSSNCRVAEVLIKHGADVNTPPLYNKNKNPLQLAMSRGDLQLVEFWLENGASLEGPEWDGLSPMVYTLDCPEVRKEMLLLLLDYGLDAKFKNIYGENLLHVFLSRISRYDRFAVEIADILLKAGVSLKDRDCNGYSPFRCAVNLQNFEIISFFVKKEVDVDEKSNGGIFPMYQAVMTGNKGVAELLLKSGADINAKTNHGWTVLHEACHSRNDEIFGFLVQRGADVSAVSEFGETPLSMLDPDDCDTYERFLTVMIKEFSKLSFGNISFSARDMDSIRDTPKAREKFERCTAEMEEMARTKFYGHYSYYSVLKMSRRMNKLSSLTKNREFKRNFERSLPRFSNYRSDLRRIFDDAVELGVRSEAVSSRLNSIFENFLPDIVIRKLAENLTVEDLPLQQAGF